LVEGWELIELKFEDGDKDEEKQNYGDSKNGLEGGKELSENEREGDHMEGGKKMRRSLSPGKPPKKTKNLIFKGLSDFLYLFCIYASFLKMAV
jgi:hypothetical protein